MKGPLFVESQGQRAIISNICYVFSNPGFCRYYIFIKNLEQDKVSSMVRKSCEYGLNFRRLNNNE